MSDEEEDESQPTRKAQKMDNDDYPCLTPIWIVMKKKHFKQNAPPTAKPDTDSDSEESEEAKFVGDNDINHLF